ncbi:NAD(P)-dependent oxidoreductase [Pseudomonas sp. NPDC007930]|uniref:C-terminal binding protein n=1 Tax=Pseudomonas sp. NPDC007930 TaxID=3364417 RepID=UPI0036EAFF5E
MNILILDSQRHSYVHTADLEQAVLGPGVQLHHVDCVAQLPPQALACEAMIAWHRVPLPATALAQLPRCRAIVRAAVGVDNIDLAYARSLGIQVANVPDYGTDEVADHTLALALALLRRLPQADRAVRGGDWNWRSAGSLPRLAGLRVGLVGLGRIGAAVARRFQALGCQVGFFDPYRPSGWEKTLQLARYERLDDLLQACQVVSLHAPLSAATHHLLGREQLRLLRGKWLINTARGALVCSEALAEALGTGGLAGAALDVLEDETQAPAGALLSDRVIWSPHMAFYSELALAELRRKAAECLHQLLRDGTHRNLLNAGEAR